LKTKKIDIAACLGSYGLTINIGFFRYNIRSSLRTVEQSIETLYSDFELTDYETDSQLVDFHVLVDEVWQLRSVFNRQAKFFLDGLAPFNSLPIQHAPAIIEWGMNWCVSSQLNTHLIIHAAVIEKDGFAAVMPAPPGSGKSTLTASLIQEGWRLLSDELTLIDLNTLQVSPFPRPVSLKNESITVIKNRYPNVIFGPISSDTAKGNVCHIRPPSLSVKNQHVNCPIGWFIFPKYQREAKTEFFEFGKAQALMSVAENSFNYSVLGETGFDVLKNVIGKANCFQFKYSNLDEAIKVFSGLPVPQ